jgi:hypothetical protein
MKKLIFHEEAIEIKQYEFQISTVREFPIIPVANINEVNLRTSPPSIVINHNEVIFVEAKFRKAFIEFVKRTGLKVEDRFDIWEAINEAFLDTEFTAHHKERTLAQLAENGFAAEEVSAIRAQIKDVMTGWAAVAWEWNYLGHYDLLLNKKQSFLLHFPKDFYWWTMEIALRNYQRL